MYFLHTFVCPWIAIVDANFLPSQQTQALMKPSFIEAEIADIDLSISSGNSQDSVSCLQMYCSLHSFVIASGDETAITDSA